MPRYEQYKSKSLNYYYTKQITNESKEINLKKPLIVSVGFILIVGALFSIMKNYAPMIDIAIKDFFSINHKEAIALESTGVDDNSSNKLKFLNQVPLFNFFIKSNTNETLSVLTYETNSKLEVGLSDDVIATTNTITREALLPFFNDYNENNNIYSNNDILFNNNNFSSSLTNNSNIITNITLEETNNIVVAENNRPVNLIEQILLENNNKRNNNIAVVKNNEEVSNPQLDINNNVYTSKELSTNDIVSSTNKVVIAKSDTQAKKNNTIFKEILQPKREVSRDIRTMKPAQQNTYSASPPKYLNNNNLNNNSIESNTTANDDFNKFLYDINAVNNNDYSIKNDDIKTDANKEKNTSSVFNNNNVNNNKERIITYKDNSNVEINKKTDNSKRDYQVPQTTKKEIIENTIYKAPQSINSDYNRVINDLVNPSVNNNNNSISVQNSNIEKNNKIENITKIENNNNIVRERNTTIERNNAVYDKKTISKKVNNDIKKYKTEKQKKKIVKDYSNIKPKSENTGIYLIEYNENTGSITLVFKERSFEKNTIENAILSLLDGATTYENNHNIISSIPRNTKLLDIFIEDSTVYLDFNEDFQYNPLGNEGSILQIYQFVYTATQFEGINNVVFLINGEFRETIGAEGSIENIPFSRF